MFFLFIYAFLFSCYLVLSFYFHYIHRIVKMQNIYYQACIYILIFLKLYESYLKILIRFSRAIRLVKYYAHCISSYAS